MRSRANIIRLHHHDNLVHEIVERSLIETRGRLGANLANMTSAELRGYVKARAAAPVLMHARRLVTERRLDAPCIAELVEQSIERVTHRVVRDAALSPIALLPNPAIPLRSAA